MHDDLRHFQADDSVALDDLLDATVGVIALGALAVAALLALALA